MEWLKKTKNAFSKCVLELDFASNSGLYFFIFQKRSKSMYPSVHIFNAETLNLWPILLVTATVYPPRLLQAFAKIAQNILISQKNLD
jgi:hypothetical protein